MAFGKKSNDDNGERDSRLTPDEWLERGEKLMRGASSGLTDIAARNAAVSAANATIALVYEQRRTNELLEQLLARG